MTVVELNTDKYDNFLIRLITINFGHFLATLFFVLLLYVGSFNLAIFLGIPLILFNLLYAYLPNAKYLIKRLEIDNKGSVMIEYFNKSHFVKTKVSVNDLSLSVKYPFGSIPGLPNGRPTLTIKAKNLRLKQYTLNQHLKIWTAKDIRTSFMSLRSLQNVATSEKEKRVLKRIESVENDL